MTINYKMFLNLIIFFFIFFLIGFFGVNFINNIIRLNDIKFEYSELQMKEKQLSKEVNLIIDNNLQEQYFHEKYGLSDKEEVIFVFPEDSNENFSS